MLSDESFQAYVGGLKMPLAGIEYLERVRANGSSRRVQSGALNVTARYPSAKMGQVRQAESRTIELPVALSLEYDDSVFEYFDQPEAIKLIYDSATGRKNGVLHTPDFLVLTRTGVTFTECKPEEKLKELAVTMPNRYRQNVEGRWVCPPGEEAAKLLGFSYQVISSSNISLITTRNIMFLSDYLADDAPKLDPAVVEQARSVIRRHPGLTLKDLFHAVPTLTPAQAFSMLASGVVYFDPASAPLSDEDRILLFETPEAATAFSVLLASSKGEPVSRSLRVLQTEIFSTASSEDWAIALDRHKQLQAGTFAERTQQRFMSAFNSAEQMYGCGIFGLLPHHKQKGNRQQKLPDDLLKLVDAVIDEHYLTLVRKSNMAVYGVLMNSCEKAGFVVPSYQWFCRYIAAMDKYKKTKARQGNRSAIPLEPRPPESVETRSCDRPFERAHIDHTQLDIEVLSANGKNLGRPWLTLMIDEYSRRILAFYITFNAPGATSALAVLRVCVSRFKRLPDCFMLDGGREFASQNFEVITARYGVRLEKRPPARARFGGVIERMFGTLNTQLLYQLAGNTQATKDVRTVTRGNDPKGQAVWTLDDLDALLDRYFYQLYDKANHSSLNESPLEKYDFGIKKTAWRENKEIDYEEFAMWTYPSGPRNTAKVQPRRGVQINGIYYWCEEFRKPTVEGAKVEVRFDPLDAGIAFAWVDKSWVKCISSHHHVLKGRSLKEIRLASEEIRRKKSLSGKAKLVNAKNLAEFLATTEPTAQQIKQQLRDAAKRELPASFKKTKTEAEQVPVPETNEKPGVVNVKDIPDAEDV